MTKKYIAELTFSTDEYSVYFLPYDKCSIVCLYKANKHTLLVLFDDAAGCRYA